MIAAATTSLNIVFNSGSDHRLVEGKLSCNGSERLGWSGWYGQGSQGGQCGQGCPGGPGAPGGPGGLGGQVGRGD